MTDADVDWCHIRELPLLELCFIVQMPKNLCYEEGHVISRLRTQIDLPL